MAKIFKKEDSTYGEQDYNLDINELEEEIISSEVVTKVERSEPISQGINHSNKYLSKEEINSEESSEISHSCWLKIIDKQKEVEDLRGGLNRKYYLNTSGEIIERAGAKFKRYIANLIEYTLFLFLLYTGVLYPYYLSEKANHNRIDIVLNLEKQAIEVSDSVNKTMNKVLEEQLEPLPKPINIPAKKNNLSEEDFLNEISH